MVIAWNGLAAAPSSKGAGRGGKDGIRLAMAAQRYGVNHMSAYKAFYVLGRSRELAKKVLRGDSCAEILSRPPLTFPSRRPRRWT
jgi:hypothetical protein